ncbi:MAG: gas vesicle protein GvpG [Thermodesulfobacteriota bacterium]
MLIVDDILLFPINGVLWIFNEIRDAAEEELHSEAEAIMTQLQQLYMMLESGKITEAEFDTREAELLDRLDAVEERGALIGEDDRGQEM